MIGERVGYPSKPFPLHLSKDGKRLWGTVSIMGRTYEIDVPLTRGDDVVWGTVIQYGKTVGRW